MKIWIDDIRTPPNAGWIWLKTVKETINFISQNINKIELLSLDHDAGDYVSDGGDYIRILDWLEKNRYSFPIHIHSMNPVGIQNMRAIIQRNCWKEIF